VLKATNGVPEVVSGVGSNFVRVDGTSAAAMNRDQLNWCCDTTISTAAPQVFFGPLTSLPGASVDTARRFVPVVAGTISNLQVYLRGGNLSNGPLTCTVIKNGAETALTLTIPAGAVAGAYKNNEAAHAVDVTPDDYISYKCVNGGSTSIIVSSINSLFTFQGDL
jgi:hypothetical protein